MHNDVCNDCHEYLMPGTYLRIKFVPGIHTCGITYIQLITLVYPNHYRTRDPRCHSKYSAQTSRTCADFQQTTGNKSKPKPLILTEPKHVITWQKV